MDKQKLESLFICWIFHVNSFYIFSRHLFLSRKKIVQWTFKADSSNNNLSIKNPVDSEDVRYLKLVCCVNELCEAVASCVARIAQISLCGDLWVVGIKGVHGLVRPCRAFTLVRETRKVEDSATLPASYLAKRASSKHRHRSTPARHASPTPPSTNPHYYVIISQSLQLFGMRKYIWRFFVIISGLCDCHKLHAIIRL